MPHHFDFSQFEEIDEIVIDVIGWISPLTIECGYSYEERGTMLYWRVKGTSHTFVISINELNILSEGNYILHFQQVLTIFREDIINWTTSGLKEKWMREYAYMFRNFIKL